MNSSENKRIGDQQILYRVKPGILYRLAPLLLWLMVVFLPIVTGNHLIRISFEHQYEQYLSQARNQLLTRSKQFETQVNEARMIRGQFALDNLYIDYMQSFKDKNYNRITQHSLIKALPDFSASLQGQLKEFSRFLETTYRFKPLYLMAVNRDPARCDFLFSDDFPFDPDLSDDLRKDLANMSSQLDTRTRFGMHVPSELNELRGFGVFQKVIGNFLRFNANMYRISDAFSRTINQRMFQAILRAPDPPGTSSYILVGFSFNQFDHASLIRQACQRNSDEVIQTRFGRTQVKKLPDFYQEKHQLHLLTELPPLLRNSAILNKTFSDGSRPAFSFSYGTGNRRKQIDSHIYWFRITLGILALLTFILAAQLSMGRIRFNSGLAVIITGACFASMFFPLSGLFWLGVSHSLVQRETSAGRVLQTMSDKIKEFEQSFFMQRYRQQLLISHFSSILDRHPENRWREIMRLMMSGRANRGYKRHINNYHLYSKLNQEYYRGVFPEEKFRNNELAKVLAGPSRRLMLELKAFEHLPHNEKQKISQMADFSSGVMEQIIDPGFINSLWQNPGDFTYATILARRDMFTAHFIKEQQNLRGIFLTCSDNQMILSILSEFIQQGGFADSFIENGFRFRIQFYPISDFYERQLRGRIRYGDFGDAYETDADYDYANALYSNSDFNQVNNLHLDPAHLVVTDTVFERSAFVVIRAQKLSNRHAASHLGIPMLLFAGLSCLFLASGITRLLLLPVAPFIDSIKEISAGNFAWHLSIKTGDEFELLAEDINKMRIRLFERQKILQLVSKNAIEASAHDLNQQNVPEKRKATILFSDIRGFTTISETHSAEDVVDMLNIYFSRMSPAIEENGGFIDKLIGDAIQAVFYGDDDRERVYNACRAAMGMRTNLMSLNCERADRNLFQINNGIGIASGTVTTGLVGSRTGKLEAAVIGDTLTRASELESCSKFTTGSQILLDESSGLILRNHAVFKEYDIFIDSYGRTISLKELESLIE